MTETKFPNGLHSIGWHQLGMRLRLLLPLGSIFLAASILGWWAASELVGQALRLRQQSLILTVADRLAVGALPPTAGLLKRLEELVDAQVTLVDYDTDTAPGWLDGTGRGLSELAGEMAVDVRIDGKRHLAVVRALPAGIDGSSDYVVVTTSLADLESAVRQAAVLLAAFSLGAALVLLALANAITSGLATTMKRLSAMARRIADGDRSVRVQVLGPPELRSLAGSLNDMVEHLASYEQRAATQARLAGIGAMAARVAHEVRNPLTAIKLQLQLIAEAPPEERRGMAVDLVTEIRRLELLLDGLLERDRPKPLDIVSADINAVVTEVVRLFEPQLQHRGIELAATLADRLPNVSIDINGTKQMLTNLLINARDALGCDGPRQPRILVTTLPVGQTDSVLRVEDNGPGLPTSIAAALMAEDPDALDTQGGFGLRLTMELALRMGTRLTCCSGTTGGACFEVTLPGTAPAVAVPATQCPSTEGPQ